MTNRRLRWRSGEVSSGVLALILMASVSSLHAFGPTKTFQEGPGKAQRDLDSARARWRTNSIPYYRLRVTTSNALLDTVTESNVRNGSVVVARGASGMPGVDRRPGSGKWGGSDGRTVEMLFQLIEDALHEPDQIVSVTYDARRGYPTRIYRAPSAPIADADVSYTVELIASPAAPLVPVSPGEAYRPPLLGRLEDPGRVYESLFGFGSDEVERLVRRVWPGRADEIISRGASPYWDSVGWAPRAGMAGEIIGTLTLPSSVAAYVMEFRHDGQALFVLVEQPAVRVTR